MDPRWEELRRELDRRFELPFRGLGELNELRATLDRVERELVLVARDNLSSRAEMGDALGISRQAARARHRPYVDRGAGDSPQPFA